MLDFWISLTKCCPKLTKTPKQEFGTFGNLLPCRSDVNWDTLVSEEFCPSGWQGHD